jgi:pyridoxamine 5'-phosphate oxidase
MAIADLRREYDLTGLRREDLDADPITQFRRWFDEATNARTSGRVRKFFIGLYKSLLQISGVEPMEVNAMTLATTDKDGRPSARVVLLKGVDERGFIFFTNYDSRKGRELAENPNAALVFYWADMERQVCVAGVVKKITHDESESYFKSRPRGSRLAAWASRQGEVVADRAILDARWKELDAKYPGDEIPMPPYWGGYVLSPERIEFWQGRPSRLHDRFSYFKQPDKSWRIERLSP